MCRIKIYQVISFLIAFVIGYAISNLFAVAELPVVKVSEPQLVLKFEEKNLTEGKSAKLPSESKNCIPTDTNLKYRLLNNTNEVEKDINPLDTEKTVRGKTKVKSAQVKSRDNLLEKRIEELKQELEKLYRNEISPMNLLHTEKCYELNEREPGAKTNR